MHKRFSHDAVVFGLGENRRKNDCTFDVGVNGITVPVCTVNPHEIANIKNAYVTEYVICNLDICFWDITQRIVKMEPKVGPETSVMNYRYTLSDVPEKVQVSSTWRLKHETALLQSCLTNALSLEGGSSRHEGNAPKNTDKENATHADVTLVSTVEWHVNK